MKSFILAVSLLLTLRGLAATGDIKSAAVEDNGWVMQVVVEGYSTNQTFDFGFATNNSGTSKVVLNAISLGFDDDGAQITVPRTIYGTKQLRFPYPNDTVQDVRAQGSDAVVRLALSDYVFQSDSNLTVSVGASWYSNNTVIAGLTVTNNSTAQHQKCIANWSWPGSRLVAGNTMTLRAVGYHRSAMEGRPLRMIEFVAQGATSGVWVTNRLTQMRATYEPVSETYISEYVGKLDISGMMQGELIRCDFKAFPWVGDSGAVLTTFDGVNLVPPLYAPQTNVCDRTGAYGVSYALVDAINGVTNGVVTTNWNSGLPPVAFNSINLAAVAIGKSNNVWFSRNNMAAGMIYLTNGDYNWAGGSTAYPNTPAAQTWITIAAYPGTNRALVTITNNSGSKDLGDLVRLSNLNLTAVTAGGCFSGIDDLWIDECLVNSPTGLLFYNNLRTYWTGNAIESIANGIGPYSSINSSPVLVRNNTLGPLVFMETYTVLGNKRTSTNAMAKQILQIEKTGSATPYPNGAIIADNLFYGLRLAGAAGFTVGAFSNTVNLAIVQNVFEWAGTESQPVLQIGADGSKGGITNLLSWHNVSTGQRVNAGYNDVSTNVVYREQWSFSGNVFDDDNIKTDTFTGSGGGSSNRIGNWSQVFAVGNSGNFLGNVDYIGTPSFSHGGLAAGFSGLNTFDSELPISIANLQYFNRQSAISNNLAGSGFGDYRTKSDSFLRFITTTQKLPFDKNGAPRGRTDPPGAYAAGNPRKGFF